MVPRGAKVFIDANAIAGAHDLGCWKAIIPVYRFVSSSLCIEEVTRRNWFGNRLVKTDPEDLKTVVTTVSVSRHDLDQIEYLIEGVTDVHDGEKSLLVLALAEKEPFWWLCGPDFGTLKAMHHIYGRHQKPCPIDKMCSLETLAKGVGIRKKFEGNYYNLSESWLQQKRLSLLMK